MAGRSAGNTGVILIMAGGALAAYVLVSWSGPESLASLLIALATVAFGLSMTRGSGRR